MCFELAGPLIKSCRDNRLVYKAQVIYKIWKRVRGRGHKRFIGNDLKGSRNIMRIIGSVFYLFFIKNYLFSFLYQELGTLYVV